MTANAESGVRIGELSTEQRDPSLRTSRSLSSARRVSVEEGYELWASGYDRDPNPLLALEERELGPLLPNLAGKDVVDVACGTGRWLAKMLSLGARSAAGADLSSAMLAVARTKASLQGRLLRADCTALPLRAEVADLLVCSFAVGHLCDPVPLARELARVARPGADVYVTNLHPVGYARGWRTGFRLTGALIEIAGFSYSAEELRGVFVSQGFAAGRFLDARLGEPERGIFAQAGRRHLFKEACQLPAVLICHFKRLSSFRRTA
jgi:SAM-dependent methyltransferase